MLPKGYVIMFSMRFVVFVIVLNIWCFWSPLPLAVSREVESEPGNGIVPGTHLPEFVLNAPSSINDQKYLGLSERKPFSLSKVCAKIIVLEIFSIYCPHCRKQAPMLNKIYHLIKQDAELFRGIKMVGIGAGCTASQLAGWKSAFHVPFPLFHDPNGDVWKKLGKPGVPCTLVLSTEGKVLAVHFGPTEKIEEFFVQLKKLYET